MAKIIITNKEFKVIEASRTECLNWGGYAICDHCNRTVKNEESGFYVAILNHWICTECYNKWIETAVRYEEDIPYEEKKFNQMLEVLQITSISHE